MNTVTDTTITVDGWGGNINFEMEMLQQALEMWGFTVIVVNDHPEVQRTQDEINEWCEKRLKMIRNEPIKLVAKHRVWGG